MFANAAPNHKLTIEHSTSPDGTPTLICRGRINLDSGPLFREEVKKLSQDNKLIFADLSAVDNVDSSGLGSVLGTYISAQADGCELRLVNVHPRVKDLLNITHLSKVFEVHR